MTPSFRALLQHHPLEGSLFSGGANESIFSWDLRGSHCRPAYELSTGNAIVTSLSFHPESNSLFAACLPRNFNDEDSDDDEEEEDNQRFPWSRSRHTQSDFSRYFSLKQPSIIRYQQSLITRMEV